MAAAIMAAWFIQKTCLVLSTLCRIALLHAVLPTVSAAGVGRGPTAVQDAMDGICG